MLLLSFLFLYPTIPPSLAFAQALYPVTFDVRPRAALDSVRRLGIDVVEFQPADDGWRVTAIVDDGDAARLAARGWLSRRLEASPEVAAMERGRAASGARAFTVFRDFDDPARGVAAYLRAFTAARANVALDSIGSSVEGRPLLALKIGPAGDSPARPNVLYLATYHAREWAATEMALRLAAWLADSLPSTPAGAALLASRDVWVIPVVNPDGYQYTFSTTRLWRKNRRPNGDGSFGVDLNRNHTAFFAFDDVGSSPLPASGTYRGAAAESEPETRAVAAFHRLHPPDAAISFHTYLGAVLFPWGHANGLQSADEPIFRALAGTALSPAVTDRLVGSSLSRYFVAPGWHLYTTNGEYADWAYDEFRTIAFTVELTAGCCLSGGWYGFEFPDDEPMLSRMFQDNLSFALSLLAAADDLESAAGPGGVSAAAIDAVWPEVHATVPRGAVTGSIQVAVDTGVVRTLSAIADTLHRGRAFVSLSAGALAEARAARTGVLVREMVAHDGAEYDPGAWSGWQRAAGGFEGGWFWRSGCAGCALVSPVVPVAGLTDLVLHFWTRHAGTLFSAQVNGVVTARIDGGAEVPVAELSGSAPEWYRVAVPLTVAAGAQTVQLRFATSTMAWDVDAVSVTAGGSALFTLAARTAQSAVAVSQNPLRSGSVTLRWTPAATGVAQVFVYSALGTPVHTETLSNDPGRAVWDGKTGAGGGRVDVANGPYYVVVIRGDGQRLRRRLLVAH